jgi:serine/threonine protein phosphatase PrpC
MSKRGIRFREEIINGRRCLIEITPYGEYPVSGGATCSVTVIFDGHMYMATVGDSDAILCTDTEILDENMCTVFDSANSATVPYSAILNREEMSQQKYLPIKGNHSPENPYELMRYNHGDMNEHLKFLYAGNKKPIYDENGRITGDRSYCKNVRNENATQVSLVKYSSSLATTRVIGDFLFHAHGLTHLPTIIHINLNDIMFEIACIIIATDGIWDNWQYSQICNFVMDPSRIEAIKDNDDGVYHVANSLIERNDEYARSNFGNGRDNATLTVVYIQRGEVI